MSLPDVLKVQTLPSIENMKILTEVLDPITITDKTCVFQIPKNGILDSGSFVQLGVTADGDFFFPLSTGIHGLIESCVLKAGNKVIASNTQYPHYTTAVRQFDSPEHRSFVDMVKSGTAGDRFSSAGSGRITYRDLITADDLGSQTVPSIIKPTTSDDTTPLFSVPLSVLIPMMRSRQLPLMSIKEHLYLEITFAQQSVVGDVGTICCLKQGSTPASYKVTPSKVNIKFNFDSLYYTDEAMDQVMSQTVSQDGLSILYEDQIVTDAAVPALASQPTGIVEQKVERELALSGRVVRSLLIQDKPSALNHSFLGKYVSRDTVQPSSLNFRINDQRVYDRDIVDPTRKYDELAGVMGRSLMVPSQLYSFDCDTDSAQLNQQSTFIGTIEGHQCPDATNTNATGATDMRATSHYEGLDLTKSGVQQLGNGAKIGVQPIRVLKTYKRTSQDYQSRDMRVFASVERLMLIKNGEVVVSS